MKAQQDLLIGGIFLFMGLVVVAVAQDYPQSAAMIPLGLGGLMALLGAALSVRTIMRWRTVRVPNTLVDNWPRFLVPLGACLAFAMLVEHIGFYTSSALLIITVPPLLGFRKIRYIVLAVIFFNIILIVVFALLLNRRLPAEFFL